MNEKIKQEVAETDELMREALKWGVDCPSGPGTWDDDMEDHGGTFEEIQDATNHWLREKGKVTVRRLIREAKQKYAEWWVKIIVSIVVAITGLLGALIGVVAILKK